MVAAAWQSLLDKSPGIFGAVAAHPATVRALTSAHRELRDVSSDALDTIAASSQLHNGLVDLHRAATARIADSFYDETELLSVATELVLGQPSALASVGSRRVVPAATT